MPLLVPSADLPVIDLGRILHIPRSRPEAPSDQSKDDASKDTGSAGVNKNKAEIPHDSTDSVHNGNSSVLCHDAETTDGCKESLLYQQDNSDDELTRWLNSMEADLPEPLTRTEATPVPANGPLHHPAASTLLTEQSKLLNGDESVARIATSCRQAPIGRGRRNEYIQAPNVRIHKHEMNNQQEDGLMDQDLAILSTFASKGRAPHGQKGSSRSDLPEVAGREDNRVANAFYRYPVDGSTGFAICSLGVSTRRKRSPLHRPLACKRAKRPEFSLEPIPYKPRRHITMSRHHLESSSIIPDHCILRRLVESTSFSTDSSFATRPSRLDSRDNELFTGREIQSPQRTYYMTNDPCTNPGNRAFQALAQSIAIPVLRKRHTEQSCLLE